MPPNLNRRPATSFVTSTTPLALLFLAPIAHELASLASRGRRIIVIYIDPEHRDVFQQAGFKAIRNDPPLLVLSA